MAFEKVGVEATVQGFGPYMAKMDQMEKKTQGFGSKFAAVLKRGAVVGVAAAGALGAASLKMGLDFEKSLAEVRTLMPEISDEVFGKMRSDILDVSKEFGIATDKAVPALYQAISAGVPKENVMEFLKVNAKLAIGGVTDLETAVDLTTTAINAFGLQASDTEKVADILFTGVKLGKTTVEELGASLFQVAPAAAASGVSLEEVTAALATLTAGGTPTAQASTQIRQALVELGKEGTKANQAFQDIAGVGFRQFIEEGGDLGEVMGFLAQKAEEDGVAVSDLFGSIEAGLGVQVLAGEGFDKFTESLDATTNSAGASGEAFDTMSKTASFKLNKAINAVKVTMTDLGSRALPVLVGAVEKLGKFVKEKLIPPLREWWGKHGPAIIKHIKEFVQVTVDLAKDIGRFLAPALDTLADLWKNAVKPALDLVLPLLEKVGGFLLDHKPIILAAVAALILLTNPWLAVAAAIAIVLAKWDEISAFFTGIGKTIDKFVKDMIQKVRDFPIVGEIIEDTVRTAKIQVETILDALLLIFEAALKSIENAFKFWKAVFSGDWDAAWTAVKDQAKVIWDLLSGLFGLALDAVQAMLASKLQMVMGIGSDLGNLIVDAAKKVWEDLKRQFGEQVNAVATWLAGAAGAVAAIGTSLGNLILAAAGAVWGGLTSAFSTAVDAIGTWVGDAASTIRGIGASVGDALMQGFSDGIRAAEGYVKGALNFLITLVEKGINLLIGLINAIPSIELPFGGGTIGIPHIDPVSIGRLHRGAWDLPRDMVARLQAGEMVLPRGQAEVVRDTVLAPQPAGIPGLDRLAQALEGRSEGDMIANITAASQEQIAEEVGRQMRGMAFELGRASA